MHSFKIFGLEVDCDQVIQGFPVTSRAIAKPDITIIHGPTPGILPEATYEGAWHQTTDVEFLLTVPHVARYHVQNGQTVTVETFPKSDSSTVALFLQTSVMVALLHQRRIMPLRACAIETPQGAALLTGLSGSGKSTITAALINRGHRLIADGIAAIFLDEAENPVVLPAFPQIHLWLESLINLQINPDNLHRVRPELDKFIFPTPKTFCSEPRSVTTIYHLQASHRPDISSERISGLSKFQMLHSQIYCRLAMQHIQAEQTYFTVLKALAKSAPMTVVNRPYKPFLLDTLTALLENHLAAERNPR